MRDALLSIFAGGLCAASWAIAMVRYTPDAGFAKIAATVTAVFVVFGTVFYLTRILGDRDAE